MVPCARPTKFATVSGAWSGNRLIVMSPRLVFRTACWSAMSASRVCVLVLPILPWPPTRTRAEPHAWRAGAGLVVEPGLLGTERIVVG